LVAVKELIIKIKVQLNYQDQDIILLIIKYYRKKLHKLDLDQK